MGASKDAGGKVEDGVLFVYKHYRNDQVKKLFELAFGLFPNAFDEPKVLLYSPDADDGEFAAMALRKLIPVLLKEDPTLKQKYPELELDLDNIDAIKRQLAHIDHQILSREPANPGALSAMVRDLEQAFNALGVLDINTSLRTNDTLQKSTFGVNLVLLLLEHLKLAVRSVVKDATRDLGVKPHPY